MGGAVRYKYTILVAGAVAAIVVIGLVVWKPNNGPSAEAEKARLHGEWRVVAAGGDKTSRPASREQVEGMRLTYTFGPATFRVDYDEVKAPSMVKGEYQFRVDPTRSPKWIDYKPAGSDEWRPGVYEWEGETLKVRWATYGRPASVADDSEGVSVLAVMERVK